MRARWAKVVLGGVGAVAVLVSGVVGFAEVRWDREWAVAEPPLRASADPATIARGKYLAYGPAHCADCHTEAALRPALRRGETPPLAGGLSFALPFGTFVTPNLTPDRETGIGRYSDGQLARMLRHNVRPSGRAAPPFMVFQNLADEDVVALISYLRSQPPVRRAVPDAELNALGKVIMTYLIRPSGPSAPPAARAPAEAPTVERGRYLAENVAECVGCHTRRNPMTGAFAGPRFAGGMEMDNEKDPSTRFVTPNLTPDPATGHITRWSEEQFVARFRQGELLPGTHMPWVAFGRMSDTDLRAIYRFLRSLPPVRNATGGTLQKKQA